MDEQTELQSNHGDLFTIANLDPERFNGNPPKIVIKSAIPLSMSIGEYNQATREMVINEEQLIILLKRIRQREYDALEGKRPGKLERFADHLINAFVAPQYFFQRDHGETPDFKGLGQRRARYYQLVNNENFTIRTPGAKERRASQSREERLRYAKERIDSLLELATPAIIGWIVAHEIEHGNSARFKLGLKLVSTLGPFIGGLALGHWQAVPSNLAEDALFSYVGSVISRYYDERESYIAGDKYWRKYTGNIVIDHDAFVRRVLNEPPPPNME